MFYVNEWQEMKDGRMLCVSSRPYYTFEDADFHASRLARDGNKDSDYTCDTANMKGKIVEALQ